jgi:hypothetical protein
VVVVAMLSSCTGTAGGGREQQVEFAVAAVEDNILTTDYTALVEITGTRAKRGALRGNGSDDENLLRIDYAATVLETYLGEEAIETIVFSRYAARQEGIEDAARDNLIVSLCRDRDGRYYLPGVGYELPPEDAVVARARQTRARVAAGELSLLRDAGRYACVADAIP